MFNMKNYLANIKFFLLFPEIKTKHKFLKEFNQLIFPLLLLWSMGFFPFGMSFPYIKKVFFFHFGTQKYDKAQAMGRELLRSNV